MVRISFETRVRIRVNACVKVLLAILFSILREKHESLGISERIALKQKTLKRLQQDKKVFEASLAKPCHKFSKAIQTITRYFLYITFMHAGGLCMKITFQSLWNSSKIRPDVSGVKREWLGHVVIPKRPDNRRNDAAAVET